jgi:flavodoxin
MKALVIYDSQFGNTEKIAQAIRDKLETEVRTALVRAADIAPDYVVSADLLVVGSPTQRFHATELVANLLKGRTLSNTRAAAFDTRLDMATVDSRVLRFAAKVAGDSAFAGPRIASALEEAGATLVVEPEGFIVEDTEGPLKAGELERAAEWAGRILTAVTSSPTS